LGTQKCSVLKGHIPPTEGYETSSSLHHQKDRQKDKTYLDLSVCFILIAAQPLQSLVKEILRTALHIKCGKKSTGG
jgi:hypothetical protein